MTKQAMEQIHPEIDNSTYLGMVLNEDERTPEYVLLPHEREAVHTVYQDKVKSFQEIIDEKVSVTGGDDWHDGAFRASDNEAKVLTQSVEAIAPYLGAIVVDYPGSDETRVTLGSRVVVKQGKASFPIDMVGYRAVYPSEVIDPDTDEEVMAISPDSPMGAAVIGMRVGEETTYKSADRTFTVAIQTLSQSAVRERFQGTSEPKPEANS